MSIISFFNQGWVGIVIGLVGGYFISRYFAVKAQPVYQRRSTRVLGKEDMNVPDRVTVLFDDLEVQRLTKTYIALWNRGNTYLDGSSLVKNDPLRIYVEASERILSAKVVKYTREATEFSIHVSENRPNEVICEFGLLDRADGVLLEVMHTGESLHPELRGTIKGVPKGVELNGAILGKSKKEFVIMAVLVTLLVSFFTSLLFSLLQFGVSLTVSAPIVAVLFITITAFLFLNRSHRLPKSLYTDEIL